MAISMFEKFGSRSGQETSGPGSRQMLSYILTGSSDDIAIKLHVQNNAPPTYDGLIAENYSIEPLCPDVWEANVSYVDPSRKLDAPLSPGEITWEFDTSGGQTHITYATLVAKYPASGSSAAPNFTGGINVGSDKVPQGVDIAVPMMRVTVRKRVSRSYITDSYIYTLEQLTGKVNNATWRGRQKGELLFLGASGAQGTKVDPEISYSFLASRNVTGLSFGAITGVDKRGHEYLWVATKLQDDSTAGTLVSVPLGVYVHQVYEYGDFNLLGI